jgi:hypothetical protein
VHNTTFEGTAREILRIGFNFSNHAVGDVLFNPVATSLDADYGNLYIAVGDGGAGTGDEDTQTVPQRLDALPGKILRITPDLDLRPGDALGVNGRYRVPTTGADPNPFIAVDLPGIRPEIFAYGFRNPQRMSWDVPTNTAIVADIGLASWEELNVLRKGGNYGYPHREGPEQLWIGGPNDRKTGSQATPPTSFPDPDVLSVEGLDAPVTPLYPVAVYSHQDGDAVAGGFVYRGARLRELYGKYVFGDITTARLLYADLADMLGADDDDPVTLATVKELQVFFDTPHDSPNRGLEITRLFDAAAAEYAARGGTPTDGGVLPDAAKHFSDGLDADGVAYGGGRADIRFALDRDGELYVLSKSDGMIRAFTGSLLHPSSTPESFAITVATDGGGGGGVTSAPRGLNCPGTCSAAFRTGSAVTLVATPDPVSAFSGWAGACSGTGACTVTAGASVVATFVDSAADMVAAVSSIPPAAAPGAPIAVAETTSNAGGAAAVSSTTRYYLSADAVKNDGDLALKTRSVTSLASGTSSSTTTSLTLPTTTPLGDYYLLACADDTFRVPERQEGNNCGASAGPLTVARPDLSAIVVADPPAGIAAGTSFTAADTVENRGGYLAGKSTTRYFLSQDTIKGSGDQLLTGTRSVASLAPNTSSSGSKNVTVPAATPLGLYWLLACADDAAKIVELDESNNCVASSSRVLVGRPDLVQLSVSDPPGEAPASLSFSVTDLVRNDGGVATVKTSTRYYLSLDGSKGADDVLLGQSRTVSVLAAGASSAGSKSVKLPVGLAPGAYYLLVCADDAAKMAEVREDNNCMSSANVLIKR